MTSPLVVEGTSILASGMPLEAGMLWLVLLILFCGGMLLFTVAFVLSMMRSSRRRWAKGRDRLAVESRPDVPDAWDESAARVPYDPDAPVEPNPDEDLPPLGGRFR